MDIPNTIKFVGGTLAGLGASSIVSSVIRSLTPVPVTRFQKILFAAGSIGLSGAAGNLATKYVEDTVDELKVAVDKIKLAKDGPTLTVVEEPKPE